MHEEVYGYSYVGQSFREILCDHQALAIVSNGSGRDRGSVVGTVFVPAAPFVSRRARLMFIRITE
jgi:hypothetical protein